MHFSEPKLSFERSQYAMKGTAVDSIPCCHASTQRHRHALAEILEFMEFRKSQTATATTFPEQFFALLGKLVQEK